MTRVLLTGFEPFGGEDLNPSMEALARLEDGAPRGVTLTTLVLPVDRSRADPMVIERVTHAAFDVVLMLGEAGGRARVTPERVAINVDDYRIADNAGHRPRGEPVVAGGPAGYFSTLPIERMVERLEAAGVPAQISNTAGTFLCNRVFYRVMHHLQRSGAATRAGFVHVPYLHEQVRGKSEAPASISCDTLELAARTLLETVRDVDTGEAS